MESEIHKLIDNCETIDNLYDLEDLIENFIKERKSEILIKKKQTNKENMEEELHRLIDNCNTLDNVYDLEELVEKFINKRRFEMEMKELTGKFPEIKDSLFFDKIYDFYDGYRGCGDYFQHRNYKLSGYDDKSDEIIIVWNLMNDTPDCIYTRSKNPVLMDEVNRLKKFFPDEDHN